MDMLKITILILLLSFGSCSHTKRTGMDYIQLNNGHIKVIDYDNKITSYIDHSGRVYKQIYWTKEDGTE